MKFVFIAKHRDIWPVAWLWNALGASRSGFHAWLNRSPSARSRSDEATGERIRASFIGSDRTYGPAGSGETCLPRTLIAVFIGSSACRPCGPSRDDGVCRGMKAIAGSQPCRQICWTGNLRPSDRTRSGLQTSL